jgi:hypothetical protein
MRNLVEISTMVIDNFVQTRLISELDLLEFGNREFSMGLLDKVNEL